MRILVIKYIEPWYYFHFFLIILIIMQLVNQLSNCSTWDGGYMWAQLPVLFPRLPALRSKMVTKPKTGETNTESRCGFEWKIFHRVSYFWEIVPVGVAIFKVMEKLAGRALLEEIGHGDGAGFECVCLSPISCFVFLFLVYGSNCSQLYSCSCYRPFPAWCYVFLVKTDFVILDP